MEFLKKYDDGTLTFPKVTFRKGAVQTLSFGIFLDRDFPKLGLAFKDNRPVYVHIGSDRAPGWIYQPFGGINKYKDKDVKGYGSIIECQVYYADFITRIAHVDQLQFPMVNTIVVAGEKIAYTGSAGTGTGPHSHFEVISIDHRSIVCDSILKAKGLLAESDILEKTIAMAQPEQRAAIQKAFDDRGIIAAGDHWIQRIDSLGSRLVTYYDSYALFGM